MSLAKQDLSNIRDVILDALDAVVLPRLDHVEYRMDRQEIAQQETNNQLTILNSGQQETNRCLSSLEDGQEVLDGKVTALHNDVVELYGIVG